MLDISRPCISYVNICYIIIIIIIIIIIVIIIIIIVVGAAATTVDVVINNNNNNFPICYLGCLSTRLQSQIRMEDHGPSIFTYHGPSIFTYPVRQDRILSAAK